MVTQTQNLCLLNVCAHYAKLHSFALQACTVQLTIVLLPFKCKQVDVLPSKNQAPYKLNHC